GAEPCPHPPDPPAAPPPRRTRPRRRGESVGRMRPWTLGRGGRMVLEDLCDDLTTLGEVVQREPEDLVIGAPQHAAVAVGFGGLTSLGFPHEAQLVDLTDGEAERLFALLQAERVAPKPDETQLPADRS